MKKKQIILISSAILAVALIVLFFMMRTSVEYITLEGYEQTSYEPEFMDEEEKLENELPADSKIQVLSRDEEGEVSVYKVIRDESDVEIEPERLRRTIDR